jgi:hypothetical protein
LVNEIILYYDARSKKTVRKMHFMFSNLFFFANRAIYEIMWKNNVELDRPQMTIWRTRMRAG